MTTIGAFVRLQTLRRRLRQPLAAIEAIQAARLRALIQHAFANVPYYRDLMRQAGVRPDDVRTRGDLRHFPLTERATLRQLPDEMTTAANRDVRRCEARQTSGSESGSPWHVVVDDEEALERSLVTIRSDIENGYRLWQRQGFVRRPPFQPDGWFKRLGILRSLYVSLFDDVGWQVERLRTFQPVRLDGQPSALMRIVAWGRDHGVTDLRPRLISTMGERLMPEQRDVLADYFGGVVYDRYGATEGGILGWECERHEGYHLNMDQVIVECVRGASPVGPGEPGAVALTNLAAYVRPLIRVTLGDVAAMDERPCQCGRSLPRLARVLGRRDEFLVASDGRWVAPHEIETALRGVDGLSNYQVVQETPSRVRARVVTATGLKPASLVHDRLRALFGPEVDITVEPEDALPVPPSGKARRVITHVAGRGPS